MKIRALLYLFLLFAIPNSAPAAVTIDSTIHHGPGTEGTVNEALLVFSETSRYNVFMKLVPENDAAQFVRTFRKYRKGSKLKLKLTDLEHATANHINFRIVTFALYPKQR